MVFTPFQNYFMFVEIMDDEQVDGDILSYQFDLYQDILTNIHETQFNDQFRIPKRLLIQFLPLFLTYTTK